MDTEAENNKNMKSSERKDTETNVPEIKEPTLTIEQQQEAKLRSKYPAIKPGAGGSAMLHKRLHAHKPKYFDSGDYNMAKAAVKKPPSNLGEKLLLKESTGDEIPTPENLPPRKPSLIQSKLASFS